MALTSSGQVSTSDIYEERFGDGSSPSGQYTLENVQDDWLLPETPNDTSIFYGRGRPEGSTSSPTNLGTNSATFNGNITNAGGYSEITCDWRFRWRSQGGSNQFTTATTENGTFTGTVSHNNSNLFSNTTYEYELQLTNIHDSGAWQTFNTQTFTTQEQECLIEGTKVLLPSGEQKNIEELSVGDPIVTTKINGFTDTNNVDKLYHWKHAGTINNSDIYTEIIKINPVEKSKTISINEGLIQATPDHSQLVCKQGTWTFTQLKNVNVGDKLFNSNQSIITVLSKEIRDISVNVYSMTLSGPHTFYANNILTHNIK